MKIALIYGGSSTEHEISILSALQMIKYFKEDEVILVYTSKENRFYIGECLRDFDFYANVNLRLCKEVTFEKKNQDVYLKVKRAWNQKIMIDMAFPLMHGVSGEDGSIQGLLELLDLPYAQSSLATCAIFMDKDLMRRMFQVFQVPHNEGVVIHKDMILNNLSLLKEVPIDKPWIVKPAKGGSSIGINCVYDDERMDRLICESFAFDNKLIVEKKLENVREFNIAVIGNEHEQILSHIEEIHIDHDYYSYSDKYGGSLVKQKPATRTCPADLDETLIQEIKELAKKSFIDFECSGVVRFDFLYSDHLMMNEINIIPGSYSVYLFKGITTPHEMIEIMKRCAKEKYLKKMKEIREIDSFIFKRKWDVNLLKK